ncbi:hypothetical protein D3C72_1746700 [compost metagenome]
MRGDGATLLATVIGGMGNDQRHVVLLPIGDSAFCMELVGTVHVTVIRCQDYDGLVGKSCSIERGQYGSDIPVDIAHAVQVIVVPPVPARVFIWNGSDQGVVRAQEIAVCRRAPRRVKRLFPACRQHELPLLAV